MNRNYCSVYFLLIIVLVVEKKNVLIAECTIFISRFEHLQKDVQKALKKPFYPTEFKVALNGCYLAKDPEGTDYCRVKVTSINEQTADCFYVDYGDQQFVNISQLKFLSNELITQLPFQVIECRLFGVNPTLDLWSPEAVDILYEYCFEPGTDFFRTLYSVISKKETARLTGGEKYAVVLMDMTNSKPVMINSIMIECGLGVAADSEDLNRELPAITVRNEEESEEEEEIEEIQRVVEAEIEEEADEDDGLDQMEWDVQIFDFKRLCSGQTIDVRKC